MQRDIGTTAMQLALRAVGQPFQPTAELANPQEAVRLTRRVEIDNFGVYSFAILDLTKTTDGKYHLIECNGSNGALTSTAHGHDGPRAGHMYDTLKSKTGLQEESVILLAYQPNFPLPPEFFSRARLFTEILTRECVANLRFDDEELEDEQVAVVCGPIPSLAAHIQREGDRLVYRGRRVVFATNPNILVELLRCGKLSYANGNYDIDTGFFHEGCLVPIVHDKARQQEIARGTGITPLQWAEAGNLEQCVATIKDFHKHGMAAVGKMNAGSGGAGVEVFPPSSDDQIRSCLQELISSAARKYGSKVETTLFPIRIFEFARSTDYYIDGRAHLWDMRVMALIRPDSTEITPCAIRLCPEPFDELTYKRDGVVSNRTGRTPSLKFMRSALDQTALMACKISDRDLEEMLDSCVRWCNAAVSTGIVEASVSTAVDISRPDR